MYVVLHFPVFKHSHRDNTVQEVDFILSKKSLVTARFDHVDALHKFSKVIEAEEITKKNAVANPSGYLFFRMLRELYGTLFDELKYIDGWAKDIENKMFKGEEQQMVMVISNLSRVLLNLERSLSQHEDVLDTLQKYGSQTFGEYFGYHIEAIVDEYHKLMHTIHNQRNIMVELRETNNSLLTSKQNEVAKIVTVLAFIAVPMSLIVSIFQIDTVARPIVGSEYDFWILVGFVLLAGLLLFSFFRYKKWL